MTALHASIAKLNSYSNAVLAVLLIEAGAGVNSKDKVGRVYVCNANRLRFAISLVNCSILLF